MQRAPHSQAAARQRVARQDPSLCEKCCQFLTYEFRYVRLGNPPGEANDRDPNGPRPFRGSVKLAEGAARRSQVADEASGIERGPGREADTGGGDAFGFT